MEIKIDIPSELSDLIESCTDVWAGQRRKYGPYERAFELTLKKDYDDNDKERIVNFCQSQMHCNKCRYEENEYLKMIRDPALSFDEHMKVVVEGRYMVAVNYSNNKQVTYKWWQDYLD